ncbi:FHA domain-containing protein [bacterium]|nr:FHA domain-containing protein [bacterium]
MDRLCPNCNNASESTLIVCPHCGYNFKAAEIIADKNIQEPRTAITGSLGFPCPFCKKEISEYHETCPFCQADLTMGSIVTTRFNWRESDTTRKELVVCPYCKYPAPTGVPYCLHCQKPLPVDELSQKPDLKTEVRETGAEHKKSGDPITLKMSQIVQMAQDQASREQLFFPPACINETSFEFGPELEAGLDAIAIEQAPKAIFSSADGQRIFHLIAGTSFYLGRQADICHVPSILFPEQAFREKNSNVSRIHCHIFIRGNRVFLKDLSKNGTFLFKEQIAYNQTVIVAHGDEISISDVLSLQAYIFTNGRKILAVRLDRLENQIGEHYILASGPVPIGNNATLPIVLQGTNELHGALYYNTKGRSWCLRYPVISGQRRPDRVLDVVDELIFGSDKYSFYVL